MVFRFKKNDDKQRTKLKKSYGYKVTICDPIGKSPREIKTFGANKTRNNDGIVMLENDKEGFSEIFPLDNDFSPSDTLENIENEISLTKKQTRQKGDNKLNKEQRLYYLKKQKKALQNPDGSFLKIDKDGMPHITYIRYRASFVPLKWNLDFGTIHTPVEPLVKNVLNTQIEKQEKYRQNTKSVISTGMFVMMIILLIWTGTLAYINVKSFTAYDESNIAKLNNRIDNSALYCAETYGKAGDNFLQASNNAKSLTDSLMDYFSPKINKEISTDEVK